MGQGGRPKTPGRVTVYRWRHVSPPREVRRFDTGRQLFALGWPGRRWHADALVRGCVGDVRDVSPFEDVVFP